MVETLNPPLVTPASSLGSVAGGRQRQAKPYPPTAQTDIAPFSSVTSISLPEGTLVTGSDYALRHSLIAEVQFTKDGILIRSAHVDEESYGGTVEIAYNDFITSIRDRYNSLSRRKGRLSQHDQSILERLQILLEPK